MQLTGIIGDFDTSIFYPQSRDNVKKGNGSRIGDYHNWNAKGYQNIACDKAQRRGIKRCTECVIPISKCPAWKRDRE